MHFTLHYLVYQLKTIPIIYITWSLSKQHTLGNAKKSEHSLCYSLVFS